MRQRNGHSPKKGQSGIDEETLALSASEPLTPEDACLQGYAVRAQQHFNRDDSRMPDRRSRTRIWSSTERAERRALREAADALIAATV